MIVSVPKGQRSTRQAAVRLVTVEQGGQPDGLPALLVVANYQLESPLFYIFVASNVGQPEFFFIIHIISSFYLFH
jgi:hypothetical protein